MSIERLLSEQKATLKLGSTLANKKAYPNGDTLVSVRGEEWKRQEVARPLQIFYCFFEATTGWHNRALRTLLYLPEFGQNMSVWFDDHTANALITRDENGTDIFRPYSRPNLFRGVLIRPYPSPDI